MFVPTWTRSWRWQRLWSAASHLGRSSTTSFGPTGASDRPLITSAGKTCSCRRDFANRLEGGGRWWLSRLTVDMVMGQLVPSRTAVRSYNKHKVMPSSSTSNLWPTSSLRSFGIRWIADFNLKLRSLAALPSLCPPCGTCSVLSFFFKAFGA